MPRQRHVISMMPFSGGLVNLGGQATIPETGWWETCNLSLGSDGRFSKRPGLMQWGQTLKEPATGGVGWQEVFNGLSNWEVNDVGNPAGATISIDGGTAKLTTTSTTADKGRFMRRNNQPSDGTIAAGETGKADLRMMLKTNGVLPAIVSATATDGFHVIVRSDSTNLVAFMFAAAGIYYYNGTNFDLLPGTDVDDSRWHEIEFRLTASTLTFVPFQVYVDGELAASATAATWTGSQSLAASRCALVAETTTAGTYEVEVDLLQYRSGNGNITGVPVDAIYDWTSSINGARHVLVAAGDLIYDDLNHTGTWHPVTTTDSGALTTFAPFQENLVVLNPRLPMRLWDGAATQVFAPLPAGAPAGAYVATGHQGRFVVAREAKPLRVYVTAANSLADWTTEDVVSGSGESFYFDIPDAAGEKITLLVGDYFGQLVIITRGSVWTLVGSSVDTYTLRYVASRVGAEGPRAGDRAAGDLLFLGREGFHSLQTVQEYGDLGTRNVSLPLRNLWQHEAMFGLPKITGSYRSSVVHVPQAARTYLAVQTAEDSMPNRLYEFNHDINQWSGPWTLDCRAIRFVLWSTPAVPMLLVGDASGRVAALTGDPKFDFGADAYTAKLRSSRLDGRSLDLRLRHRSKLWKTLRLFVLPRGDWKLTLTYTADGHGRTDTDSITQNRYLDAVLNSTFILNASKIVDSERVGVIDVPIDMHGKWFEFAVEQAGADEDMVLVGAEVEFLAANEDKEDA